MPQTAGGEVKLLHSVLSSLSSRNVMLLGESRFVTKAYLRLARKSRRKPSIRPHLLALALALASSDKARLIDNQFRALSGLERKADQRLETRRSVKPLGPCWFPCRPGIENRIGPPLRDVRISGGHRPCSLPTFNCALSSIRMLTTFFSGVDFSPLKDHKRQGLVSE